MTKPMKPSDLNPATRARMGLPPAKRKRRNHWTGKLLPLSPLVLAWRSQMYELPGEFVVTETHPIPNRRGHWSEFEAARKRHWEIGKMLALAHRGSWPETVRFTRYAPQLCDEGDGLPTALKAIRDGIADGYGVSDGPNSPIKWEYRQERTKRGCYGVRIEFLEDMK